MLQLQCSALGILKLHSDLLLCLRDRAAPDFNELFSPEQNLRAPSWDGQSGGQNTQAELCHWFWQEPDVLKSIRHGCVKGSIL